MQKKRWTESILQLTILLSLFRVDWDSYLRTNLRYFPELNELILGQSLAYTQTQFHNIYNEIDGFSIHPKSINSDRFQESIFQELQALNSGNYRAADLDITALLLDRHDTIPVGRTFNLNSDQNNNEDETSEVETAQENVSEDNLMQLDIQWPGSELTREDMDLIDVLWKQDIDMGVCREIYDGSYRQKELEKEKQLELERQKDVEKVDEWAGIEYRVDSETGEYIPLTPQAVPLASAPSVESGVPNSALDVDMIDYNLEECIQMLREHARQQNVNDVAALDEEGLSVDGDSSGSSLPSPDFEQQWQDLASVTELLQFDLAAAAAGTQPANDAFAVNATTNGNVSLQNATIATENITNENITNLLQNTSMLSPTQTLENLRISSPPMGTSGEMSNFSMDYPGANNNVNVSFGANANTNTSDSLLASLVSDSMLEEIGMMDLSMDEDLETLTNLAEAPVNSPASSDDRDSAVSVNSGSGSVSDWNDTMSVSSFHRESSEDDGIDGDSVYGDIEGATAGDYMDQYLTGKEVTKEPSQYEKYQRMSSEPPSMDHIKHNHTYPQPSDSDQQHDGKKRGGGGDWNLDQSPSKKDRKGQRLSRDEKRAKGLGLPISNDKIIELPVEEFNELLSKYELTEPQLALIRDIRRRGKNKVAAQYCRKRKMDAIVSLEDEVANMRAEKDKLRKEQRMIDKETAEMKDRFKTLYREVFESLRDESGQPYNPQEFSLQQSTDGNVFLVPNTAISKNTKDQKHKSKSSRKKRDAE